MKYTLFVFMNYIQFMKYTLFVIYIVCNHEIYIVCIHEIYVVCIHEIYIVSNHEIYMRIFCITLMEYTCYYVFK